MLWWIALALAGAPDWEAREADWRDAQRVRLAVLEVSPPQRPYQQPSLAPGECLWWPGAEVPADCRDWLVVGSLEVPPAGPDDTVAWLPTLATLDAPRPSRDAPALALGEPRAADPAEPPRFAQAPAWLSSLRARRAPLLRSRSEALLLGEHRAPEGSLAVVAEHATEERLRAKLATARSLVLLSAFAVHDGPRSGVLLAPVQDGDGFVSAWEMSALPWSGAVVVLTAPVGGEGWEALGLGEAALVGGASAVVMPLGPRPDGEVLQFVRRLADGLEAGQTLRRAVADARRYAPQWRLLGRGEAPLREPWRPGLGQGVALGLGLLGLLGLGARRPSRRWLAGVLVAALTLLVLAQLVPALPDEPRQLASEGP